MRAQSLHPDCRPNSWHALFMLIRVLVHAAQFDPFIMLMSVHY